MEYIENWKTTNTIDKRKEESKRLITRYERVPIVVDRADNNGPVIMNHKFLVPNDITVGQFLILLRKRIELHSSIAIFLFSENGTLISSNILMSHCYKLYKNEDCFLYITYGLENTFGTKS